MGTSEVHLPEGENLIGVCCSDELHFFSLFFSSVEYFRIACVEMLDVCESGIIKKELQLLGIHLEFCGLIFCLVSRYKADKSDTANTECNGLPDVCCLCFECRTWKVNDNLRLALS